MIEVDAVGGGQARARRRTWLVGGVLIALSALLALGTTSVQDLLMLPFDVSQVLFYAGAVVFAIGLGRAGSVTARRPLGTSAIVALAVWKLIAVPLIWSSLGISDWGSEGGIRTAGILGTAEQVVAVALALIGVVMIGRVGVVPKPWNWAPLWALAVVVGLQVLLGVAVSAAPIADQTLLTAVFGFAGMLRLLTIAALGVLAIVLAMRSEPGTTTVYSSEG